MEKNLKKNIAQITNLVNSEKFILFSLLFFLISISFFILAKRPMDKTDTDWYNWTYWESVSRVLGCDLSIINPFAGQGGFSFPLCITLNPTYWVSDLFTDLNRDLISKVSTIALSSFAVYFIAKVVKMDFFLTLFYLLTNFLFTNSALDLPYKQWSFFIFEHLNPIHSLQPFSLTITGLAIIYSKSNTKLISLIFMILFFVCWMFFVNPFYTVIYLAFPFFFIYVFFVYIKIFII